MIVDLTDQEAEFLLTKAKATATSTLMFPATRSLAAACVIKLTHDTLPEWLYETFTSPLDDREWEEISAIDQEYWATYRTVSQKGSSPEWVQVSEEQR